MHPATKQVVSVSIHFMILFTAFNAFQTIVTKIHEDQGDRGLGPYTFAITYFVFLISNLFVSRVKYSEKWQIVFASLTYVFNYLTGFFMEGQTPFVKYAFATAGSVANGIGASFLWTSIGSYIHKVCHIHNKMEQKGHYFGLFNTIFCISTVLGAIVVTFGLTLLSTKIYFVLVSGVAFFAFIYGIFFIEDIKISESTQNKSISSSKGQKPSIWKQAKKSAISTIRYYPTMKYTLGLVFLNGINIGVTTSTMLHLLPATYDTHQDRLNAGICLILHGIGCLAGGYFGGKFCDKFKIKLSSTIYVFLYCVACVFTMGASEINQMWSAALACFLWGWLLYYLTANQMVICSRLYEGKVEAFAITKQFHCISFIIYEVVALSTNNSLDIKYIMMVLIVFAIPAIWGVYKAPKQIHEPNAETHQGLINSGYFLEDGACNEKQQNK